jgi:hypothetical protein
MDYTPVNQTYEVFSKTFGIPAMNNERLQQTETTRTKPSTTKNSK